jgi:hypothetical protein
MSHSSWRGITYKYEKRRPIKWGKPSPFVVAWDEPREAIDPSKRRDSTELQATSQRIAI